MENTLTSTFKMKKSSYKIYHHTTEDAVIIEGNIPVIDLIDDDFYNELSKHKDPKDGVLIIKNNRSPTIHFYDDTGIHLSEIEFDNCPGLLYLNTDRTPRTFDFVINGAAAPKKIQFTSTGDTFNARTLSPDVKQFCNSLPTNTSCDILFEEQIPTKNINAETLKPLLQKRVSVISFGHSDLNYASIVQILLNIPGLQEFYHGAIPNNKLPEVLIIEQYLKKPKTISNMFKCKKELERLNNG